MGPLGGLLWYCRGTVHLFDLNINFWGEDENINYTFKILSSTEAKVELNLN